MVSGFEGLTKLRDLFGFEEFAQVAALVVFVLCAQRTAAEEPDRAVGQSARVAPHKAGGRLHPMKVVGGAPDDGGVVAGRIGGLPRGLDGGFKALLAERGGDALGDALGGAVTACVSDENAHIDHSLTDEGGW